MDQDDIEERVRARAYEIWEEEGRPHGRDNEHWQRAAHEVRGQSTEPLDTSDVPTAPGIDDLGASVPPGLDDLGETTEPGVGGKGRIGSAIPKPDMDREELPVSTSRL